MTIFTYGFNISFELGGKKSTLSKALSNIKYCEVFYLNVFRCWSLHRNEFLDVGDNLLVFSRQILTELTSFILNL